MDCPSILTCMTSGCHPECKNGGEGCMYRRGKKPHPEHAEGAEGAGETNFRPIPVVGELEKILSYREGGCKSCEWHPDVCKHCLGSLFDNGRLTHPMTGEGEGR